jgi:hypothetical protein
VKCRFVGTPLWRFTTPERHRREGYTPERDETSHEVAPASVGGASQRFVQVVELPKDARNVHFYTDHGALPEKYWHALQNVR